MFVNVIRGSTSLTVLSLLLSLMQADEDRDSGTESDEEIDDPDLPSGKSILFSRSLSLFSIFPTENNKHFCAQLVPAWSLPSQCLFLKRTYQHFPVGPADRSMIPYY
jgi:hypothetical protein